MLNSVFDPLMAFVKGACIVLLALQTAMEGESAIITVVADANAVYHFNFMLAKNAF
jgi:hypothetical protein